MDILDEIMSWEEGYMSPQDEVLFFQELVDNGQAWSLQGMYGRRATELINAKKVFRNGKRKSKN